MISLPKYEIKSVTEKIRSVYNLESSTYSFRYTGERSQYYYRLEDCFIKKMVNLDNKFIMDLGCGTGRLSRSIINTASKIVGIDFSRNMVEAAHRNKKTNEYYIVMDALNLGFKNEVFDAAFSIGMFEYVEDLRPFLNEVNKTLKIGSPFVFTCNNSESLFRKINFRKAEGEYLAKGKSKLGDIKNYLQESRFKLISYQGTFFISPDFVWKFYRFFPFRLLKRIYLEVIIQVNLFLNKSSYLRRYCGEFIILARRR